MDGSGKRRHKSKDRSRTLREQAAYDCDWCHEQIVVPLDVSAGATQEYVEDCPVCCRPNVIHVEVDDDGVPRIWATRE
jgi:transcription elongation factor Elf1